MGPPSPKAKRARRINDSNSNNNILAFQRGAREKENPARDRNCLGLSRPYLLLVSDVKNGGMQEHVHNTLTLKLVQSLCVRLYLVLKANTK